MTDDDDERTMKRIFEALFQFLFLTERSCRKKNLAYSEDAVRELLTESKPWLNYYGHGIGEKPIVFRLNRNLGYIAGNLFVGTKADKPRFALLHLEQRKQPGAHSAPRPAPLKLGIYGVDYGQARTDTRATAKREPIAPPEAGYAISDHLVTKKEAKSFRQNFTRDQIEAATAAALAKPRAGRSQHDRRLIKNAAQKRWRQNRARKPRPT